MGVASIVALAWLLAAASLTTALIGTAGGAGNDATDVKLASPTAAVPTPDGGFLVTDYAKCTVRKVSTAGTIATVAGDGGCKSRAAAPVSCPSAAFCAVGWGKDGVAVTSNPAAAKPTWVLAKGMRSSTSPIQGISCASPSLCVVADKAGTIYTSKNPAGGASTWHAQQVTSARPAGVRAAVACPTTTLCVTLGNSDNQLLVSQNPGAGTPPGSDATWTPVTVPNAVFRGVNCRSGTLCVAFGSKSTGGGGAAASVASVATSSEFGDSSKWPPLAGPTTGSTFFGVSCPSSSICVGAGDGFSASSSNASDASPTWLSKGESERFEAVACASTAGCFATDRYGNFEQATPSHPNWVETVTTDLARSSSTFCDGDGAARCSMSCPTTGFCMIASDLGTLVSTDPTGPKTAWSQREPGDGGPATGLSLEGPSDAVPTQGGGFLVQEGGLPDTTFTSRADVRKVEADGTMHRVAGTGGRIDSGAGVATRELVYSTAVAGYNAPGQAVTTPGSGFLLSDTFDCVIKKVDAGHVAEVAGVNFGCSHSGDGGDAGDAHLFRPISAVPTPDGGYLIAEFGHLTIFDGPGGSAIRKVAANGKISTVAGNNTPGYSGDGGPATAAQLNNPTSAVPTKDGGFLIADWGNNVVRKVSKAGIITTVAGSGEAGQGGDGGDATDAKLIGPTAAVPTPDGGFLLGSFSKTTTGLAVRKVTAAGTIKTVAGTNPTASRCVFKSAALKVIKKKPKIKVTLTCNRAATAKVGGKITRKIKHKGKPTTTKTYKLKPKSVAAAAAKVVTVTLGLPKGAVTGLKKGDRESAALTLKGTNANGTGPTAKRAIKKLKLPKPKR